jgi:hypothetical protein
MEKNMRIVYTAQRSGFERGVDYRHPAYFRAPKPDGQSQVEIVGDFPVVKAAYEAIGVKVVTQGAESASLPTRTDIARMGKAELTEWLEAHGVEQPEGTVAEMRTALASVMFVEA